MPAKRRKRAETDRFVRWKKDIARENTHIRVFEPWVCESDPAGAPPPSTSMLCCIGMPADVGLRAVCRTGESSPCSDKADDIDMDPRPWVGGGRKQIVAKGFKSDHWRVDLPRCIHKRPPIYGPVFHVAPASEFIWMNATGPLFL